MSAQPDVAVLEDQYLDWGLPGSHDIKEAVEWDLNSVSVVVECGGFKGRWARQIALRYNPRILVFEPQVWAVEKATAALKGFNAQVFGFALGDRFGRFPMGSYGSDGCTFVVSDASVSAESGYMHPVDEVFSILDLSHIDLMLINIEGYEFTLIPYMLRMGLVNRINNLMVQFHEFMPDSRQKFAEIARLIEPTHDILWSKGLMLTAWRWR